MTDAIPVIDVTDYLVGRPGALQATARQVHDALTTVRVHGDRPATTCRNR